MNEQLMREVASYIEKHPSNYDQNMWIENNEDCGTTACIAGWAMILSGKYVVGPAAIFPGSNRADFYDAVDGDVLVNSFEDTGAEVLDIPIEDARILFDGTWVPADGMTVSEALEKYAAGTPIDHVTGEKYREDDGF